MTYEDWKTFERFANHCLWLNTILLDIDHKGYADNMNLGTRLAIQSVYLFMDDHLKELRSCCSIFPIEEFYAE